MNKPREEGHHAVNDEGVYMEDMLMEHTLGRPLADDEIVWHRNGNTLDNRNSNLVLMKFGVDFCLEAEEGEECGYCGGTGEVACSSTNYMSCPACGKGSD